MAQFDETDLTILRLLTEDARRSFSDIADAVDLSPPAVSDRVSRLREAGVIRRFTVDVDRSQLRGGVPVLVEVDVRPGRLEDVRAALRDADPVEHLYATADGDVVFHARTGRHAVRSLLGEIDPGAVRDYEVRLLADVEWTPSVDGDGFAVECVECGNPVGEGGVQSRLGDTLYHFCCPTCQARFEERYERLEEGASG